MSLISIVFLILLIISLVCILHSYIFFPLILKVVSKSKNLDSIYESYKDETELPRVFIFCSLHNESKVILQKIDTMLTTSYPDSKVFVYLGLDNCSDNTEELLTQHRLRDRLQIYVYPNRRGKSMVLNDLVEIANNDYGKQDTDVYIFTDANVFFSENTLYELSKFFKDNRVGLCAANVINPDYDKGGIGIQEKFYISREGKIKHMESLAWGTMIGAFGAC